jgi:glycosyltransferase involved in cell wall biosynthesis
MIAGPPPAASGFNRIELVCSLDVYPKGDMPAAGAFLLTVLDAIGRHARLHSLRGGLSLCDWKEANPLATRRRSLERTVPRFLPNELRLTFGVPGDLATPTGGYGYDRRIIRELRQLGWQVDVVDVGDGFPFPSVAQRATALAILAAVPAGCPTVLDGLAFGALPEAGALRSRAPLIALVHQPLALDPGLDTPQAESFRETERAALAAAERVVVTSEATARIVTADYDVPSQRVSVVRPGNDPVPPAPGSNDGVVRLLTVGSVVPVKGYDLLIAAVAMLADMPWRLTIAGWS